MIEIKTIEEWQQVAMMLAASGLAGKNATPEECAIRMAIAKQVGLDPLAGAIEVGVVQGRPVISYMAIYAAMQRAGFTVKIAKEAEWAIQIDVFQGGDKVGEVEYTERDFIAAGDLTKDGKPAKTKRGYDKVGAGVRKGVLFGRAIRRAQSRFAPISMGGLAVIEASEGAGVRERVALESPEPEIKQKAPVVKVQAGHSPVDNSVDNSSKPMDNPVDNPVDNPSKPVDNSVDNPVDNSTQNWRNSVMSVLNDEPYKNHVSRIQKFVAKRHDCAWLDLTGPQLEKVYSWLKGDPAKVLAAVRGR